MSKSKSRSPAITEMNFVSSLPLEEAVRLIGGLATPATPVTLTEVDEDNFRFEIAYQDPGVTLSSVTGSLRRWEGTFTRLDCTGKVRRTSTSRSMGNYSLRSLGTALLLSTGCLLLGGISMNVGFILGIAIIVALVVTSFDLLTASPDEFNDPVDTVYFRERDALLNLLIQAFTAAGDVSLDGSSLDQSNDAGVDTALASLAIPEKHKQHGKI